MALRRKTDGLIAMSGSSVHDADWLMWRMTSNGLGGVLCTGACTCIARCIVPLRMPWKSALKRCGFGHVMCTPESCHKALQSLTLSVCAVDG
eukprot:518586-Amphidinium_carterae.3